MILVAFGPSVFFLTVSFLKKKIPKKTMWFFFCLWDSICQKGPLFSISGEWCIENPAPTGRM